MENRYDTIHVIETLQEAIQAPHTISYGGCGIYALEAYNALRRSGFDPQIVCLNERGYTSWLDGLHKGYMDLVHLMVQLDDMLFDAHDMVQASTSVHAIRYELNLAPCFSKFVVDVETVEVAVHGLPWNTIFDRKRHVPIIKSQAEKAHKYLRLLR